MDKNEYRRLKHKVEKFGELLQEGKELEQKIEEVKEIKDKYESIYIDFKDTPYYLDFDAKSDIPQRIYMAIVNILETKVKEIVSEMESLWSEVLYEKYN